MSSDPQSSIIVVGVDGSEYSIEALRWPAAQAELTGAQLRALNAWSLAEIYAYTGHDYEADAHKTLEEAVTQALGGQPHIPVTSDVVEGHAAAALIDASREAELLVVGSHGRGAFTGMLLGSVSQHCASHAHCTTVIVRQRAS